MHYRRLATPSLALLAALGSFVLSVTASYTGLAIAGPILPDRPLPNPLTNPEIIVTWTPQVANNPTLSTASTCAGYSDYWSTNGVKDTHQVHNRGVCQLAEFQLLFEGIPLAQYFREVSSGQLPAPFTVTPLRFRRCYEATNLRVHIAARIPMSELDWVSNKSPACLKEWNRTQAAMAKIWPLNGLVRTVLLPAQRFPRAPKAETCGPFIHGASPQQQLLKKIEPWLADLDAAAQQKWTTVGGQYVTSTAQSACALHCNVCDSTGWAGMIKMTMKITSPTHNYSHNTTQLYFVGGPSTVLQHPTPQQPQLPSITLYPAELDLNQTGHYDDSDENPPSKVSADWHVDVSSLLDCSAPSGKAVCFKVTKDTAVNTLSVQETSSAFTDHTGPLKTVDDLGRPGASTQTFQADEIKPETVGVKFEGIAGAMALSGSRHQSGDATALGCIGFSVYTPNTCTMDWSWDLFNQ